MMLHRANRGDGHSWSVQLFAQAGCCEARKRDIGKPGASCPEQQFDLLSVLRRRDAHLLSMAADGDVGVVDDLEVTSWHSQSKIAAHHTFRASFCTMAPPAKGRPMLSNCEVCKGPSFKLRAFRRLRSCKLPAPKTPLLREAKLFRAFNPDLNSAVLRIHEEPPPARLPRRTPRVAWARCKRSDHFQRGRVHRLYQELSEVYTPDLHPRHRVNSLTGRAETGLQPLKFCMPCGCNFQGHGPPSRWPRGSRAHDAS